MAGFWKYINKSQDKPDIVVNKGNVKEKVDFFEDTLCAKIIRNIKSPQYSNKTVLMLAPKESKQLAHQSLIYTQKKWYSSKQKEK